jgi:phage shock protein PspC (stress-responsive transcriptional regulator)
MTALIVSSGIVLTALLTALLIGIPVYLLIWLWYHGDE